jgi:hypothetical protein
MIGVTINLTGGTLTYKRNSGLKNAGKEIHFRPKVVVRSRQNKGLFPAVKAGMTVSDRSAQKSWR